jgi:hypothetical protein
MSKYLVIQSFVGSGTWYPTNEDLACLYNNSLIPSFARYCEKYGYGHVVYRDQIPLIQSINEKSDSNHGNLYHQYLSALNHRDDDVDYFVFPDADFYITGDAKPFVETNYIAGDLWMESSLVKKGLTSKTFTAIYGGIQIMTKEAALSLAEYLESRMIEYLSDTTPMQLHPNMLIVGEWLTKNKIQPDPLLFAYNHILDDVGLEDREWTSWDDQASFWHLYGKRKSTQLEYVLQHKT